VGTLFEFHDSFSRLEMESFKRVRLSRGIPTSLHFKRLTYEPVVLFLAITAVGPPVWPKQDIKENMDWLKTVLPLDAFAQRAHYKYPNNNVNISFWKKAALCAEADALFDINRVVLRICSSSSYVSWEESQTVDLLDKPNKPKIVPGPISPSAPCGMSKLLLAKPNIYTFERGKYFWSSHGFLGIVPSEARVGDRLCWLGGPSEIMLVVRPSGKEGEIIGTARFNRSLTVRKMDLGPQGVWDKARFHFDMETFQLLTIVKTTGLPWEFGLGH
jgi:hypothetical protein